MSDSETTNKFSLIDLPDIPDSIDNAFKNLSDSLTKNIGKTFADIWFLVLKHFSDRHEKTNEVC